MQEASAQELQVLGQTIRITLNNEYNQDDGYDLVVYEFVNIKGHQVGSNWVAIFTEDGKTVILPASRINKMVISQE